MMMPNRKPTELGQVVDATRRSSVGNLDDLQLQIVADVRDQFPPLEARPAMTVAEWLTRKAAS